MENCETCRFCKIRPEVKPELVSPYTSLRDRLFKDETHRNAVNAVREINAEHASAPLCKLQPEARRTKIDDWCGQWKGKLTSPTAAPEPAPLDLAEGFDANEDQSPMGII